MLLGAYPFCLVGSLFECGGFHGCTPTCTLLATRIVPALIVLTAFYLIRPRPWLLFGMTAISFVLIVPNCRCSNPLNGPWIRLMGFSPECLAGAFAIGIMSIAAIVSGRFARVATCIAWGGAIALAGFAITHHRYHWPW